jgi:hypothetical protein
MTLSFLRRLSAASLMTVALAGPALGQSQRSFRNDVVPSLPVPRELTKVEKTPAAKAFGSSEPVTFTAASGKVYQLTRFHGLYVDILLPSNWLQALSTDQIRHFLDRTDLIYQHLLEMVGTPPSGDGAVQIMVLPEPCGDALGCAPVGRKGVEMADDPYWDPTYWRDIAADLPNGVLVHELTHNFDVFSRYLEYGYDSPHDWTNFITTYYSTYTQEGYTNESPKEVEQDLFDGTSPVFLNPATTWEGCVLNFQCPIISAGPEFLIGGFGARIASQYGPRTVTGFSSFMSQYTQTHQAPASPEDKNDLYLEALAAGAHRDLGCVVDTWHWYITDGLRQTMLQLYGANPDCEDHDHDGFSVLQGDCNDHNATIHPGAVDRPNRIDDNCDGVVDERLYSVPTNRNSSRPVPLTLPAEATATLAGVFAVDTYQFHLKSPGRVRFGLCPPSLDTDVQLTFTDRDGTQESIYDQRVCEHETYSLAAGIWSFKVGQGDLLGPPSDQPYSVSVASAGPWPLPAWARTAPPHQKGDGFELTATTAISSFPAISNVPTKPTQVRFWVSGQGFVGTVPYSRAATFTWTPPPGVDPVADGLTYRAQVLAGGTPAYTITPPQGFAAP